MRKQKVKQAELFNKREMRGGSKPRDHFHEECVAAYLKYMKMFSELDDNTCHRVQKECEEVRMQNGIYTIKSLNCRVNCIHFMALRDCINLRVIAIVYPGYYHHEEELIHPHVTNPAAFKEARVTFKQLFSEKYEGRDAWFINFSMKDPYGICKW